MKNFLILCTFFLASTNLCFTQINFFQSTLPNSTYGGSKAKLADIDGDGDMDIYASTTGSLEWYANDGYGNFTPHVLDGYSGYHMQWDVIASDIDGDGDLDLVSGAFAGMGPALSWAENTDGNGTFGLITFGKSILEINGNYVSVFTIDIDADGYMDVVAATTTSIDWYRNTDGLGTFATKQTFDAGAARSLHGADVDGDGYMDLVVGFETGNQVVWYKNLNGSFGSQQVISTNTDGVSSVYTGDIDGDGDLDVVATTPTSIVWYENTDGNGAFGPQKIISIIADGAANVFTSDIDGDGDLDVLSASAIDDKIAWYENTNGLGTFGVQQVINVHAGWAYSVTAGDLDGDGDNDVVSSALFGSSIEWYRNLGTTFNEINGQIMVDINGTGCASAAISAPNLMVKTDNGTDVFATFTQNTSSYNLFPSLGTFVTNIPNIPTYYTPSPVSYTANYPNLGNTTTGDFCLVPNQTINDVLVYFFPKRRLPRPGQAIYYEVIFANEGTTQLSGTITIDFDNTLVGFIPTSTTPTPISQTSNSLTFSYSNLNPFETRTFDIRFVTGVPPVVNLGDLLPFTATIYPISGDVNPTNNIHTVYVPAVASYDPNDITCLEGDEVLTTDSDGFLHYLIRFQNTGTSYADKVKVTDILDSKLDAGTLQLLQTSHNCRVEMINNQVDFVFDAIYLQDSSSNEPESHGYIFYKIKPKSTVVTGDIVSAQVDIFFDYNSAVVTNTANTEFVAVLPVELVDFNGKKDDTKVLLNWSTASEVNNKGFEIQHSRNGVDWNVQSFEKGQINSNVMQHYRYVDNSPLQGLNYYRLKQIDIDGAFEYSKIIAIDFGHHSQISIFPNPTTGLIKIQGLNIQSVILLNTQGYVVKELVISNQHVDLSDMAKGLYFMQIKTATGVHTERIYKE